MRRVLSTVAAAAACAAGVVFAFGATGAFAHSNPCHSNHICPSDHHTYIWVDAAGQDWDCAKPEASEYNPAVDTSRIVYDGLPYYCHAAGGVPPATTTTAVPAGGVPPATTTTAVPGGEASPPPPPDPKPASHLKIPVGRTVPVSARTQRSRCTLGDSPDRQCSPGASYSALTKAVICSAGFRTGDVRYVPDSEKHAVEAQYGMVPKPYGRTLEIDHIISLELGGSNDIANLFPEKAPGYHAKDKLENTLHRLVCSGAMSLHAVQVAIATNWQALYARVYGGRPNL